MFCCRRRESLQLERSENAEANQTDEIFTVTGKVPPPGTGGSNAGRTPPRHKDGGYLSRSKPATVFVGEVDSTDAEHDVGGTPPRIVFGRQRPRVFDVLRRRTAELCVYLKQKVHTRTLHIEDSSGQDPTTDVQPQLPAPRGTHTTAAKMPSPAAERDFSPSSFKAARRQKMHLESTESDGRDPVQNLESELQPSVPDVNFRRRSPR